MISSKTDKERFLFSALSYQDEQILPDFKEQPNLEWVKYGDNNLFPNELLSLFEKSGIHNAIIETKVRMMLGDGIVQDDTENPYSEKTQLFIDNPNPFESMDDIYKKCSMDFELYGLAYIEVLWGKGKNQIAEIHHIDATKIRWNKLDDKNRVSSFWYSRDWTNYRKTPYVPVNIPIFSDTNKSSRQILPIIRYTPGLDYYSYPDYIAGTKWIQIDTEIANFHFNNLKNGMTPSIFFGFPVGDTTNEERETIEEKIKDKYQGTNNAGKFILAFYDAEGDKKPEVTILEQTNADKQYDLLNKTTLQQILVAHQVTNENLVGISTPGKLGSSSEMLESYELYYNTVVKPEQQKVLNSFKKIMLINGYNDIKVIENQPLNVSFSENIMAQILTQNEMREMVGYDSVEETETTTNDPNIVDDETGLTVNNQRFEYDFAVRSIDRNNASFVLSEANLDDHYVWRIRGNVENQCPSCLEFNGQVKQLKDWLNTAIPGQRTGYNFGNGRVSDFPHSPYSTFCEDGCRCRLTKIKM